MGDPEDWIILQLLQILSKKVSRKGAKAQRGIERSVW